MRWRRRRNPALERARRETAESTARSLDELATSKNNNHRSQEVADRLRRHNEANRYDTWLEQVLRSAQ